MGPLKTFMLAVGFNLNIHYVNILTGQDTKVLLRKD
jgi:hypothetical protein